MIGKSIKRNQDTCVLAFRSYRGHGTHTHLISGPCCRIVTAKVWGR